MDAPLTLNQNQFFLEHAVDGQLTPEQMAQLLELPEGDIEGPESSNSGTPSAASEGGGEVIDGEGLAKTVEEPTKAAPVVAPAPEELDPANTAILAKDGKHLIDYSKLVEAREGEKHWKAQAEAAQKALADLQDAAKAREAAGTAPTKTDADVAKAAAAIEAGVDPDLFGDFSPEAVAKGVRELTKQAVEALVAPLADQSKQAEQARFEAAQKAHYDAIYGAHPDADSIVESKELAAWIEQQPSFAREGYRAALTNGSTAQIIEFFDTYKAATGIKPTTATPTPKVDVAAAAKAAIAAAKTPTPASLSDFPGGAGGPADEMSALRELSGVDLMSRLEGKTPEQIEALMARLV